jgi:phenylacetate-CoA ligase
VEAIVRRVADVEEFQIRLFTADGIRDEIEVLVEVGGGDEVLAELARELSDAHEGLRFGVRRAEPGSLPRFELKAKRLTDEREVWGGTGERKAM